MSQQETSLRELAAKWRDNATAMRANQPLPAWQRAEELEACADELEAALSARDEAGAVGEVRIENGCIVSTSIKRPLADGGYDVVPQVATPPASGEAAVLAWLIVYRGKVIGYATHDSKPHVRLAEDETLVPVAAVAPAGMVLVPREPTVAIRGVLYRTRSGIGDDYMTPEQASALWAELLAAPTPPATAGKE